MEGDKTPNEEVEEEEEDVDEVIDPNSTTFVFSRLEANYKKIISEVEGDPSMNKFMDQYNRLFEYLVSTRDSTIQLETTRDQLEEDLSFTEERLTSNLKVIENDAQQIDTLKGEIGTSLKMIDNAQAREQSAQEVIDNLRKQIANLNHEIDFKNKMAQGELEENPTLMKHREAMEREKTKLISEVTKLSEKLTNALAYQEELEHRTSVTDLRISDISNQLEETEAEVEKFKRNKERLETDLGEYREDLSKKTDELEGLREEMQINQKLLAKYELQLKEQTTSAQKCFKELEIWNVRFNKMQDEYDRLGIETEHIRNQNVATIKSMRGKDDERTKLQYELVKLVKQREQADRKARLMEIDKQVVLDERDKLHDVVLSMSRDCEMQKQARQVDKKEIGTHEHEREILNRNLLRQQAVGRDHSKLIKMQEQVKKRLDAELDGHIIDERKQSKQIMYLEKERDRLMEDALEKNKRMEDTIEELDVQNKFLTDLKKNLAENELRYKSQQALFDTVRAERNALQKSMQQTTAECNEMKGKMRIIHRQGEQLKEEISCKEQLLIKSDTIKRKLLKEKEDVKVELNNTLDVLRTLKEDLQERAAEEERMRKVIAASEKLIKEQTAVITGLMNERDVLGSQLVRRNDEISMANEKIRIIQTTLHHGEAQYDERLSDIKLLKVEIKRLRLESALLSKSINSMKDFKIEVFHMERELSKERMKSRALEDELHNPMNIHRWRKLEGTDPEMPDLLQKVSQLQRRLLVQAGSMIDVEKKLRETVQLYYNLRILVSKQQHEQIIQMRLNKTHKQLLQSTVRNKCIISELNMLERNNMKCNQDLERAKNELLVVKERLKVEKSKRIKMAQRVLDMKKKLPGAVISPEVDMQQSCLTISSTSTKKLNKD